MKKINYTFLALLVIMMSAGLVCSCHCGTLGEGRQPESVEKAAADSAAYMFGYSAGMQVVQSGAGALSEKMFYKGIKDAIGGVVVDYSEFNRVISSFLDQRREAIGKDFAARSEKMLSENKNKPGVFTTESGLQYQIIKPGDGLRPTADDIVEVNYEGTNLDGKVFDSSYDRGEPATFPLRSVIKGWTEGIQLISEGGEVILWIPAELAYGGANMGQDIRPNEALKFRVELLKVTSKNNE